MAALATRPLVVMIIMSWNSAGAFRTKFHALERFEADVHIIQECEDPERSHHVGYKEWASNYLWAGINKNSGLGIFARDGIRLEKLSLESGRLELFLPCRIDGSICLLAVWTKQANSPTFQYIGQLWKYLEAHKQELTGMPLVVAGDLNSNVRWDKWDRWWNHSDVVRELSALGVESAYHHARSVAQGAEPEPTFFLQRNLKKPYHIDYAFIPRSWLEGCSVRIGDADEWIALSDHLPLRVAFNTGANPGGGSAWRNTFVTCSPKAERQARRGRWREFLPMPGGTPDECERDNEHPWSDTDFRHLS